MIDVFHRAVHLYREDAYQEYCWSVDAYSAWQPASFVYLCYEAFRDHCATQGLRLVAPLQPEPAEPAVLPASGASTWPRKDRREGVPADMLRHGEVLRLLKADDGARVQELLADGLNVVALLPVAYLGIYFYSGSGDQGEQIVEGAREAARTLGIENPESRIPGRFSYQGGDADWSEIEVGSPGRLFVVQDGLISDGSYMEGYSLTDERRNRVDALVREFARFNRPLVRCDCRASADSWPTHEPLGWVLTLTNHGPLLKDVLIRFELPPGMEPLSPLERALPRWPSLESVSFAVQAIPRAEGVADVPSSVTVTALNVGDVECATTRCRCAAAASQGLRERHTMRGDDAAFAHLAEAISRLPGYDDLGTIARLAALDVAACLNKMRKAAERLTAQVIVAAAESAVPARLVDRISLIAERRLLSQRAVGYLHTIRVLGNQASHDTGAPGDGGEVPTDWDVRVASYALATVVEEVAQRPRHAR